MNFAISDTPPDTLLNTRAYASRHSCAGVNPGAAAFTRLLPLGRPLTRF